MFGSLFAGRRYRRVHVGVWGHGAHGQSGRCQGSAGARKRNSRFARASCKNSRKHPELRDLAKREVVPLDKLAHVVDDG